MSATSAAILGCAGPRLTEPERRFFARAQPWGFILFARNCESAAQTAALVADLRDCVGRRAPVLIDQEGGRVTRLSEDAGRRWLPPLDAVARAGERAADMLRLRYRVIAHELSALGIDVNCAPLADIATPATHPFLRNRCLGETPGAVAARARAVAEGLLAGGVLPVLKHIPGHGRATADSHHDLPRVEAPLADLRLTDFAPFAALSDLPMGMTAHVVYAALDDRAATVSTTAIGLIRQELGFGGLLMTDDLSMQALSGDVGGRAAAARAAGCDIALHCNGDLAEMEAVIAAAGPLAGAAAARAEAALARRRTPEPVDIAALEAKHDALLAGARDG
ncbi:glycoside hydrolase family 3 N-terminal domain-containing protein [Rhodosalinus sp.]|uniref:glycoside hydrolase family 3 N-terminal domain-containing protein n=1 Tax=Rhodosalinus sp. TaxID=2047741 RepID=UPI003979A3E5